MSRWSVPPEDRKFYRWIMIVVACSLVATIAFGDPTYISLGIVSLVSLFIFHGSGKGE